MGDSFIVSVTSGKGGVGKTVISANLSIVLAEQGFKVLLVDGDFGLSNAEVILGVSPEKNLGDYFTKGESLPVIASSTPYGFHFIPSYSGMEEAFEGFPERSREFLYDIKALSKEFDLTILDTGSGITKKVTELGCVADEIVVISTSDPASMLDAYAVVKVMAGRGKRSISLVINRCERDEAEKVYDVVRGASERFLGLPLRFLGWLPEDGFVPESVKKGSPISLLSTPFSVQLREIAERIKELKGDGSFGKKALQIH